MSLKENMDYIKGEVSAQESLLDNVFKVEKLYKKYKVAIFATVGVVVAAMIGFSTMEYINEKNKMEANELFNKAITDSSNSSTMDALKSKDEKLYQIASFMNNNGGNVQIDFLKEISLYSSAAQKNELSGISKAAADQNFLMKDFAIFNKALILAQEGKYKQSKETLKLISSTSSVAGLSKMLEHYLITK